MTDLAASTRPLSAAGRTPATSGARLEIRPVRTPADLNAFIRLPHRLYRGHPGYWPAPDVLVRSDLDRAHAPFFAHAEAEYWLAWCDGAPVGRISAQVDRSAQANYGRAVGFFGFLDAEDDASLHQALIRTAEDWLRARGCQEAWGPLSHSLWELAGMLVENFQDPAMFLMPYAPPYGGAHVEAAGYTKIKDLHAWIIAVGAFMKNRKGVRLQNHVVVRTLNPNDYEGDIRRVVDIFNDAWSQNWGFVPFTELDVVHLAKSLRPILDPKLLVLVEYRGEPAAMCIGVPNLLEAARDLNGRLLPFGWAKLLWRLQSNQVRSCRIPLMGLRRQFHDTILGASMLRVMFTKIDEGLSARKFERLEMSWILEDNFPMIRVLKAIGGEDYKTYRVYGRSLA
jgi:hypothetical protein